MQKQLVAPADLSHDYWSLYYLKTIYHRSAKDIPRQQKYIMWLTLTKYLSI